VLECQIQASNAASYPKVDQTKTIVFRREEATENVESPNEDLGCKEK
jgi:hypothetical protein